MSCGDRGSIVKNRVSPPPPETPAARARWLALKCILSCPGPGVECPPIRANWTLTPDGFARRPLGLPDGANRTAKTGVPARRPALWHHLAGEIVRQPPQRALPQRTGLR